MRWRCEWCGKPHERNDPPCDECGHHSFERAVVPKAPEDADVEDYVWVCADCDRVHQRHSPPCSRCGGMQLEKRPVDYLDPGEVGGGGWIDALEWWHGVGIVLALALAVVVAMGALGVVDLPGSGSAPRVTDVPGSAETAEGHDLAAVEAAFVEELNDARAEAGRGSLASTEELTAVATHYNRRLVKSLYGDADHPDLDDTLSAHDYRCEGVLAPVSFQWGPRDRVASTPSERALAEGMVAALLEEKSLPGTAESVGVDVHASPGGSLIVTVVAC